ncbi:hypothetical protein O4H61_08190 [Roseovarius aestuarii]|nr:hypothetical protein [Roseovarius aestuarii]
MIRPPFLSAFSAFWMFSAGAASALSCVPVDPPLLFKRVHLAAESYVAVYGTLTFDPALLPKTDWEAQHSTPQDTRIPAVMSGHSLDQNGFKTPFEAPVTLRVLCFGPWCAQPPANQPVMGFVQQNEGSFTLTTDPCGGDAFFQPSSEMLQQIHTCFIGGDCESNLTRDILPSE